MLEVRELASSDTLACSVSSMLSDFSSDATVSSYAVLLAWCRWRDTGLVLPTELWLSLALRPARTFLSFANILASTFRSRKTEGRASMIVGWRVIDGAPGTFC